MAVRSTVLYTEVLKCFKADKMTFVLVFKSAGYSEKVVPN